MYYLDNQVWSIAYALILFIYLKNRGQECYLYMYIDRFHLDFCKYKQPHMYNKSMYVTTVLAAITWYNSWTNSVILILLDRLHACKKAWMGKNLRACQFLKELSYPPPIKMLHIIMNIMYTYMYIMWTS